MRGRRRSCAAGLPMRMQTAATMLRTALLRTALLRTRLWEPEGGPGPAIPGRLPRAGCSAFANFLSVEGLRTWVPGPYSGCLPCCGRSCRPVAAAAGGPHSCRRFAGTSGRRRLTARSWSGILPVSTLQERFGAHVWSPPRCGRQPGACQCLPTTYIPGARVSACDLPATG